MSVLARAGDRIRALEHTLACARGWIAPELEFPSLSSEGSREMAAHLLSEIDVLLKGTIYERPQASMTETGRWNALTYQKGVDDVYLVKLDGEYIGRITRVPGAKPWKAVDSNMAWKGFYQTRKNAGAGLARHWRKCQ